jgi:hypothetical protein
VPVAGRLAATRIVQVNLAAHDVNQDIVLTRSDPSLNKVTLDLRVLERLKTGDKVIVGAEIVISQKDKRILADRSGGDEEAVDSQGSIVVISHDLAEVVNPIGIGSPGLASIRLVTLVSRRSAREELANGPRFFTSITNWSIFCCFLVLLAAIPPWPTNRILACPW